MTDDDDLRELLRSEARRYDPDDDGWTGIQRGVRAARRRRRLQGGALGGLALVATALAIGLSAGGSGTDVDAGRDPSAVASAPEPTGATATSSTSSPATSTTATTSTTSPVAAADLPFPGIWPFTSPAAIEAHDGRDARFGDPAATATAFARDHVGMLDPAVGPVALDGDGGATVELRPRGEGGEPAPDGGPSTVVSLRSFPTTGGATVWTVVGARSPNIVVDEPAPGAVASSASERVLRVRGRGTGYEGTVRAVVLQDGARPSEVLGEAVGIMGSTGEVGRLSLDVAFDAPSEPGGALFVTTDTGLDGVGVPELTAVRLRFDEVTAPPATDQGEPGPGGPCPTVGLPGEPGPDQMDVTLYLTCDAAAVEDPGADAAFAAAVRRVPRTARVLQATLEQLVAGPTEEERRTGLSSSFSPATAGILRGVTIADGTAVVDLEEAVNNASTSAGQLAFRGALNRTVFQFPTVERIEYRLGGSCDAFWRWQQVGDCRLVTRADL